MSICLIHTGGYYSNTYEVYLKWYVLIQMTLPCSFAGYVELLAGMGTPLTEVEKAIEAKQTASFHDVVVHLVNFESTFPHPRRFAYKACPHQLGHGGCCGLSKELGGHVCGHMVEGVDAYNFEVVIVDAVFGQATPIRAEICDSASVWLGLGPSDLRACTEQEQLDYIRAVALQCRRCAVVLHVKDGVLSVEILSVLGISTHSWVALPESVRLSRLRVGTSSLPALEGESTIPSRSVLLDQLENIVVGLRHHGFNGK